jgi:putative SOS response-associated peptidase YedK
MCGRYVPPDEAAMERFWRIDSRNWRSWIKEHFNVAPTTQVPIIIRAQDGTTELISARWGLIPSWWKKDTPPSLTFNARSEEAAQKPTWRQSLRTMRCLMPARGWYEWYENEPVRSESGRKVNQPYFLYCPNAEVIAFAGLWSVWERPGAEPVVSCALLSKEAAPSIAAIHHRMPVVLRPEKCETWLNPATSAQEVENLIAGAREGFEGYAVSTKVNNARNDFPELLEKVRVHSNNSLKADHPDGRRP